MVTISGAVASDYWVTSDALKPSFPMLGAFYRACRYHAGSAAYGALIIAVIRM